MNEVKCCECKETLDESDNDHNSDTENYPYNYLNYDGLVYYLCNDCYINYNKEE